MPLEILTEDLMKERGLARVIISHEPSEFLWGFKYTPQKTVKTELIYQGENNKVIYVVNSISLDELKPSHNVRIFDPVFDIRYHIFAYMKFFEPIGFYKAFFKVLNEDKNKGDVSDEEYLYIFHQIDGKAKKMHNELSIFPSFFKRSIVVKYRKMLEDGGAVALYMQKTKDHLMNKH